MFIFGDSALNPYRTAQGHTPMGGRGGSVGPLGSDTKSLVCSGVQEVQMSPTIPSFLPSLTHSVSRKLLVMCLRTTGHSGAGGTKGHEAGTALALVKETAILYVVIPAITGDVLGAGPGCERASWKKALLG